MLRSVTRLESWLLCAASCVLAAPALAGDGVLEISQTCVAAGCFPGDAPGFPVRITAPGSYRLTSNLDVTGEPSPADVTAIELGTSNVKIDLNGFSIIGPGTTGVGDGIDGFPSARNVTVVNGTVRGMGRNGVDVDRRARIEGVTVDDNGTYGIRTDIWSIVVGNIARGNGDDGIRVTASVVRGNTADQNGGGGIDAFGNSTVIGNRASFNTGAGIELSGGSGYTDNVVNSNTGGTIVGGVEMGRNVCDGNTTCP